MWPAWGGWRVSVDGLWLCGVSGVVGRARKKGSHQAQRCWRWWRSETSLLCALEVFWGGLGGREGVEIGDAR